jgi:hypothetical protein
MSNFEENIQRWVSIDNQMKLLNEKIRDLRDKKGDLTQSILNHAEENHMGNPTIQISDGKLKFTNTKVSEPLTFKYLEKALSEIIRNEMQVKQIIEHIKKNREVKLVQELKRFY